MLTSTASSLQDFTHTWTSIHHILTALEAHNCNQPTQLQPAHTTVHLQLIVRLEDHPPTQSWSTILGISGCPLPSSHLSSYCLQQPSPDHLTEPSMVCYSNGIQPVPSHSREDGIGVTGRTSRPWPTSASLGTTTIALRQPRRATRYYARWRTPALSSQSTHNTVSLPPMATLLM